MAKDLDDYAWEDICARILGHEIPHGLEISAATLLAADPSKRDPVLRMGVYRMPDPPKDKGKSVLRNGGAGDTMPKKSEAGFRVCQLAHRSHRGAT